MPDSKPEVEYLERLEALDEKYKALGVKIGRDGAFHIDLQNSDVASTDVASYILERELNQIIFSLNIKDSSGIAQMLARTTLYYSAKAAADTRRILGLQLLLKKMLIAGGVFFTLLLFALHNVI